MKKFYINHLYEKTIEKYALRKVKKIVATDAYTMTNKLTPFRLFVSLIIFGKMANVLCIYKYMYYETIYVLI